MRTIDPQDPAITYAAVLDALPGIAYMARPDGVVTHLSRGWERFTGNSAREVLEQGYDAVIHPDDLPGVAAAWDAARAAGEGYRDEFRIRFGDGSYHWVVSQAEPVRSHEGPVAGWFGTLTDITDLRLAEQVAERVFAEVREQAEFVERLLDATDDCIKILSLDGRLVSMSPNGRKALAIADFAAVEGADWLAFWQGEDRLRARAALDAARAGGRGTFTGSYAVEGRPRWWDVVVTPIAGRDGAPERLLAVSRDVTGALFAQRALAESEERHSVFSEALPGITWTARADGELDFLGAAYAGLRGRPPEVALGNGWLESVHPEDRERAHRQWRSALASGEKYDIQFRVRVADGSYRWQLVRALPQRDARGAIVRWVGVNIDVEEQRRADEAREQFVRLVEASDDFIGIGDAAGNATYVNAAGRRMLEIGSMEDARKTRLMQYFTPEDRPYVEREILPAVERGGRWSGDFRLRNFRTGAAVPVSYNVFSLHDQDGRRVGVATVSRDLRARLRLDAALRALAETGSVMFSSLDYEQTLRNVADVATRSFATYCIIDVVDDAGRLRRVAAAHSDPRLQAALEQGAAARDLAGDHPAGRAFRDGVATLVAAIPPDWMQRTGMAAGAEPVLRRLDPRSMVYAPIFGAQGERVIGVLTCVVDGRDPRGGYSEDDLRFAEELARRAGLAFDHARAYERERRIAVTLQAASLSTTLPAVDHLRLSAEYRPGNDEATIGGDWYDAFLLDDGRVAITVGDVLGNGLGAAVTMGKVRQAIRAVATVLPEPNAMLDVADRTVRAESDDAYATAMAGIVDPAARAFTFASAGHPGPVLRRPDGRIEEFSSPDLLLGLRAPGRSGTATIPLAPGSALVLFTDGLIEATRDVEEGYRRLHAAVGDAGVMAAENPARALVEHVLGGRPATDDIAVLVAQVGGWETGT